MTNQRQYPALACLAKACESLKLAYHYLDKNNNFIELTTTDGPLFFTNSSTPFNNESMAKICLDKEFTYLLLKDTLALPKTIGYFDPHPVQEYTQYRDYPDQKAIVDNILTNFTLPLIIKRNTGSHGQNVFLCQTPLDIKRSLKKIYTKKSKNYDYVALAQDYIQPKTEYRVIIFNQQLILAYEKNNHQATFVGNLSPLHYEGATAVIVTDETTLTNLQTVCSPIFNKLPLKFTGLDIIEDQAGKFWLIEINSKPGFDYFLKNNPKEHLVEMYKTILTQIL